MGVVKKQRKSDNQGSIVIVCASPPVHRSRITEDAAKVVFWRTSHRVSCYEKLLRNISCRYSFLSYSDSDRGKKIGMAL